MKFKKINDKYIIRLERGNEILQSLKEFCEKNEIKCGYFTGIGALDSVELAHYFVDTKKYSSQKIEKPLEIVNLTGNVTTMGDEVYLHCHITLSDEEMHAIAGHLKEGRISATCEIVLVQLSDTVNRKFDEKIGLNLMDM